MELQRKNNVPEFIRNWTESAYATSDAGGIFGDFIGNYQIEELQKNIRKINYFSILTTRSTDKSIIEQEVIYVLFIVDEVPKTPYMCIESLKNGNVMVVCGSIRVAFNRLGILKFKDKIAGLNEDGASANMGQYSGLGKLIKI